MRAVFYATIAAPLSAGWYDPRILDSNFFIRPTSLKGLWRWWARAFAAGALYEAGCVGNFLERVHAVVADGLGLGSTGRASSYTISVEVLDPPKVDACRADLQRFKLLALGRRGEKEPALKCAVGGEFRITVEGDHKAFAAATSILAVALTLSGLGKGGRKALGSLDVVGAEESAPRGQLHELIERARRYLAVERCGAPPQLPPISAVAKEVFEVYRVNAGYQQLHNLFLRPERSSLFGGNYRAPDPLGGYAWFLGLPRSQRGTGYIADVGRRASAVFAAWHSNRHIYGGGGYVSVFLSADWPPKVVWVRKGGRKEIAIDAKALQAARRAFLGLLGRFSPQRVW
ncbi:MAG: type III-B CRISPR module RAMP protein Cmr1 [Thermoproteus sp.]